MLRVWWPLMLAPYQRAKMILNEQKMRYDFSLNVYTFFLLYITYGINQMEIVMNIFPPFSREFLFVLLLEYVYVYGAGEVWVWGALEIFPVGYSWMP